ncbi:MAG: hypothetical protein ACIALR_01955 [Blastopirellula sp. JB062]
MYKCQRCGKITPARTPAHQIVVSERHKEYGSRSKPAPRGPRMRRDTQTIDRGGRGHEIVEQLTVCPDCAARSAASEEAPRMVNQPAPTQKEYSSEYDSSDD